MDKKYLKLGIKQTIQKHWMDRVVQMVLAGMSEKEIRADLDNYLSTQKQSGGIGERGSQAYVMAISVLAVWFAPANDLHFLRDDLLKFARQTSSEQWLPLHWAIVSASYPFWFNTAKQTGRLFNLQERITQPQIFNRLKEQYGDRETVARNARYAVRSFVAWGVLKDSDTRGCYIKAPPVTIVDKNLAILLLEAALHTTPEGKSGLTMLFNNPAFFPFDFPVMTGDFINHNNDRIEVNRYGLDDEMLKIK
jgi:hypothetical protein